MSLVVKLSNFVYRKAVRETFKDTVSRETRLQSSKSQAMLIKSYIIPPKKVSEIGLKSRSLTLKELKCVSFEPPLLVYHLNCKLCDVEWRGPKNHGHESFS